MKHAKASPQTKKIPPIQKSTNSKNVKETSQPPKLTRAQKLKSLNDDTTETEVNDREPRHLYRNQRPLDEQEGLPFKDVPRHLGVEGEDENELEAGYARAGARDRDFTSDDDEGRGVEAVDEDEDEVPDAEV